jgi:hypothetical protein
MDGPTAGISPIRNRPAVLPEKRPKKRNPLTENRRIGLYHLLVEDKFTYDKIIIYYM